VLGLFGANYTWYFFLSWLPYYFESERHYSHDQLAIIASLPFWGVAASSMILGVLADGAIRRGQEPGRTRQKFISIGLLCCCMFTLLAALAGNALVSNISLILACVSMAGYSSNHWALTQRLSGAEAAGKWTGLQNCLGNFSGVIAPFVSGATFERTHSFFLAFAIACGILLISVCGYWFVIGMPHPIVWRARATSESSRTTYLETF
jgi:MFS transporter, ACS family, D-galactonate transporter